MDVKNEKTSATLPRNLSKLSETYLSGGHWDEFYRSRNQTHSSAGKMVTASVARTADRLLERDAANAARRILDVAAGAGELVHLISAPGRLIVGADISHVAMSRAKARKSHSGPEDYVVMDASKLSLFKASLDMVTCVRSIWTFPDVSRCLSEFRRVLRPGAPLLVQTWGAAHECRMITVGAAILSHYLKEARIPEGVRGPFDFTPKSFQQLVTEAGFHSFQSVEYRERVAVKDVAHYWDEFAHVAETAFLFFSRQPDRLRERISRNLEGIFEKLRGENESLTLSLTWHVCVARA